MVVGVDDHNCAGLGSNLAAQICNVGIPFGSFVAAVVDRFCAGKKNSVAPQRVVGSGNQHFITGIEQRHQSEVYYFAYAVSDEYVVNVKTFDSLACLIADDSFAGFDHTLEITVGNACSFASFYCVTDTFRQGETESGGVAGVQLQYFNSVCLHAHSLMV